MVWGLSPILMIVGVGELFNTKGPTLGEDMGKENKISTVGLALAGCILLATTVYADPSAPQAPSLDGAVALADFGPPVASEILGAQSGGQGMSIERIDILANSMNLNAEMKENLLFSSGTGSNQVSDNAFGNASGISTVVQNSGNQVIINNAFILNLQMQ